MCNDQITAVKKITELIENCICVLTFEHDVQRSLSRKRLLKAHKRRN